MRAGVAEGQESGVGRRALLPQSVVQLKRVRRCRPGQRSRQAQLVALASVQGVLAGTHIACVGRPRVGHLKGRYAMRIAVGCPATPARLRSQFSAEVEKLCFACFLL